MKDLRNKLKNVLDYLQKNYFTPRIIWISIPSLFLLVQFTPILSILWLSINTLYFLYIGDYKDISKIWGITIGVWYLIFSTSLHEITILIGFENTEIILNYLSDNNFQFEILCFQTVLILHALSSKIGFSIYIPAIVNAFSFFSKLFEDKKTGCSGKGDSGEKKESSRFSFGKKEQKSQSEADMFKCEGLARDLERSSSMFHSSNATTDGKRTVTYTKTWFPGFGVMNNCHARDASELEKELFDKGKNKKDKKDT